MHDAPLPGFGIVGDCDQSRAGAELLCLSGEGDGACGGIGSCRGDDRYATGCNPNTCPNDFGLLLHGEGRPFAGHRAYCQAVNSGTDLSFRQLLQRCEIGSVVAKRCNQRRRDSAEAQ